jgi:hypothetical protein
MEKRMLSVTGVIPEHGASTRKDAGACEHYSARDGRGVCRLGGTALHCPQESVSEGTRGYGHGEGVLEYLQCSASGCVCEDGPT